MFCNKYSRLHCFKNGKRILMQKFDKMQIDKNINIILHFEIYWPDDIHKKFSIVSSYQLFSLHTIGLVGPL